MPSYVEQATLRVKDESTTKIKKINRSLNDLFRTARKGRNIPIKFTGLERAERQLSTVRRLIQQMPRSRTVPITVRVRGMSEFTRKLTALSNRKAVVVPIRLSGIDQSISKAQRLLSLLNRLSQRQVTPNVGLRQTGSVGAGPRAAGLRAMGGAYVGGALGALSTTPFPGNIPTAFNIAAAYMTVRAAHVTARTAVDATLEAQASATKTELIIPDQVVQEMLTNLGRQAAAGTDMVSITRGKEIARDLYITGFRGEVLEGLAPLIARLEGAAFAIAPDKAESIATLANKMGNLAAVTEDAARAQELATGIYKAAIIQGETFNAPTLISALRVSGVAQTINEEGLIRFAAATDELGRRSGSGLQRFIKILSTDVAKAGAGSGVSKGVVAALIAAGVRGEKGVTGENRNLLETNPGKFIEDVVGGLVREQGLDPRMTGDRAQVKALLQEMGFVGAELKFVLNELAAGSEREKALLVAAGFDPDRVEGVTVDDMGFQIKNLVQQFRSLSSEGLTPLFEVLAPLTGSVADFMKELAFDESPNAQLKRLGFAAGIAAGALGLIRGTSSLLSRISPSQRAATALTGSAVKLDAAAAALQRAAGSQTAASGGKGVVGASGGSGGRPRVRTGLGFGRMFLSGMTAYTMATSDLSPKAAEDRREDIKAGTQSAFEAIGLGDFARRADERNTTLEEKARRGEVSVFLRFLRSLGGVPLPETSPNAVAAQQAEARRREGEAKISRLLAVMERNEARIGDPTRSEASRQNLEAQQSYLMDQIKSVAAESSLDLATVLGENQSALALTFSEGSDQIGQTITTSAGEFGPIVGQTLLGYADQMGQAIGERTAAALRGVTINTNVQAVEGSSPMDTGERIPM